MAGPIANTYAPPKWLTKDFLQSALREGGRRSSLIVSDFKIRPSTNVGDNMLSQMFRASVKVHNRAGPEDLSVIIKCMPEGKAAAEEFINELKIFSRETTMLADTLPLLQALLDDVGGPKLNSRLYFKQDSPNTCLVMEDLCASGFRNVDRLAGLDIDHSLLVMEYIATFHAASLAAFASYPEIKATYGSSFLQRNNEERVKYYLNQDIANIILCLKKWKDFPDDMIRKVERWVEIGVEKVLQCTDLKEDELNVLNHGDLETSNIMFKYENNKPVGIRFVDFQLSCYNSAAFDLHYFIFTSPQIDVRLSRIDEMLTRYHETLAEICSKLKYPLEVTLDDTKKMFYDRIAFGFFATFSILPLTVTNPADAIDLNEYLEKGQADRGENLSKNEKFRKMIEMVLPFFDQHGVFD